MKPWRHLLIPLAVILFLMMTGCGIGYNSLLFVTRTNMGVDIDTTPPTAEISIARQEGVIAPSFEEGKTLSVLAGFNTSNNDFQRLVFGTSSAFAVGEAAYLMGECYNKNSCTTDESKGIKLNVRPTKRRTGWFGSSEEEVGFLGPEYVNTVFFGTHSTFGLKVEWNGTTGQYPSALKLGYNRKELAWAPVSLSSENSGQLRANVPSLVATLDIDGNVGTPKDTGMDYIQYFATGKAATELVRHPDVRKALTRKIAPDIAAQLRSSEFIEGLPRAKEVVALVDKLADGEAKKLNDDPPVTTAKDDKLKPKPLTGNTDLTDEQHRIWLKRRISVGGDRKPEELQLWEATLKAAKQK